MSDTRTLYWRTETDSAIRHGDWKLVAGHGNRSETYELYNLASDPYEKRDFAIELPERSAALRKELMEQRRRNAVSSTQK